MSLIYHLTYTFIKPISHHLYQNLQLRNDFGNQWVGPYYGGHVYDGYEYAMTPPHDPSMYAAAYGAYPMYGIPQQQVN